MLFTLRKKAIDDPNGKIHLYLGMTYSELLVVCCQKYVLINNKLEHTVDSTILKQALYKPIIVQSLVLSKSGNTKQLYPILVYTLKVITLDLTALAAFHIHIYIITNMFLHAIFCSNAEVVLLNV